MAETAELTTGGYRTIDADKLPAGWVSVIYFPQYGDDETVDYHGPVIEETAHGIRIEVFGEPLAFWFNECIVTRAETDLAGTEPCS